MTDDLGSRVQQWRHDLHQIPETAFTEHATAGFVAGVLQGLGFEVETGLGGTGVVGSLTRGSTTRSIGLRADMDALPLSEQGRHEHLSRNPGTMHACGHDGHMAMVLGAAAVISEDAGLDGTLRLIFQPAEEPGHGARAMLDDGLLERFPLDALYGLHNLPGLPTGHLHTRPGAIMASEDNFEIRVQGRGGHAARPHMVIDPLVVGAEIVMALQTVVARSVDPAHSAVLSCTDFRTDGIRNAIPGEVVITGDTRSFDPAIQAILEERIRSVSTGVASAHGATCSVSYTHEFAPTVNDPGCAALMVDAAVAALGPDRVDAECSPIMGSEDFGVFAREVPSCFAFIGNGTEPGQGGTPLHSSDYDFNDEALLAGIDVYVRLVRQALAGQPPNGS